MAIIRIWHGWTTPDNAPVYERLLNDEVFPSIEAKNIPGYTGIELLRTDREEEVEFVTVMRFDSLDSVIAFQGKDFARAYVPDAARAVLARWDEYSDHYEIRTARRYADEPD